MIVRTVPALMMLFTICFAPSVNAEEPPKYDLPADVGGHPLDTSSPEVSYDPNATPILTASDLQALQIKLVEAVNSLNAPSNCANVQADANAALANYNAAVAAAAVAYNEDMAKVNADAAKYGCSLGSGDPVVCRPRRRRR